MQTLIIDKPLCTLNEYIKAERSGKYIGASIKKAETFFCMVCAKNQLRPIEEYPLVLDCMWYTKNKRKDPDGIAFAIKFILDGMQDAGIIVNDGQSQIKEINHKFGNDVNERVEITISDEADIKDFATYPNKC